VIVYKLAFSFVGIISAVACNVQDIVSCCVTLSLAT
jgi:hypothetical protein